VGRSTGLAAEQFEGINNVNLFPVSGSVLVAAGDVSQSWF
jgi:hypothetical protein